MTALLFLWSIVGVLLLQVGLLLWLCWPTMGAKLHCAWCWKRVHLAHLYPESWSSTICETHYRYLLTQSTARRARRSVTQEVTQ